MGLIANERSLKVLEEFLLKKKITIKCEFGSFHKKSPLLIAHESVLNKKPGKLNVFKPLS